jgi:archaetidylinositol phosphate synthase
MSHNTLIHRLVRPAVRLAATTGITPNQLTTARLATGLAAAACFAAGGHDWLSLGGALFLVSLLLDRADGELARQTRQSSPAGHRYDLASDGIASVTTFVGLGLGLADEHGLPSVGLGLLAGVGIGVLFLELNVLKIASVSGLELFGGRLTVDPDDALIFVPVLIWVGLAWPMVIAAAIITPLAALAMGILWRLRATGAATPDGDL